MNLLTSWYPRIFNNRPVLSLNLAYPADWWWNSPQCHFRSVSLPKIYRVFFVCPLQYEKIDLGSEDSMNCKFSLCKCFDYFICFSSLCPKLCQSKWMLRCNRSIGTDGPSTRCSCSRASSPPAISLSVKDPEYEWTKASKPARMYLILCKTHRDPHALDLAVI